VKATAPPERVNWPSVVAVFVALLILIAGVAGMVGFVHAHNWLGVADIIGSWLLAIGVGLVAERITRPRARGQR
jgi:hypothetical protein